MSRYYISKEAEDCRTPKPRGHLKRGGVLMVVAIGLAVFVVLGFWPAASVCAQQPSSEEGSVRFSAVDIFVDSNSSPLAAWQLEFVATNGVVKIVGIEGGEHEAYRQAPFYDPRAMQHERVIIAAFSVAPPANLPVGKTRVATIHLQVVGRQPPAFELKVQTAADANGNRIPVTATFEERKSE